MAQTTAHLVGPVVPYKHVRQWVLALPTALRLLRAAQPKRATPVPADEARQKVLHKVISRLMKPLTRKGVWADAACSTAPGRKR